MRPPSKLSLLRLSTIFFTALILSLGFGLKSNTFAADYSVDQNCSLQDAAQATYTSTNVGGCAFNGLSTELNVRLYEDQLLSSNLEVPMLNGSISIEGMGDTKKIVDLGGFSLSMGGGGQFQDCISITLKNLVLKNASQLLSSCQQLTLDNVTVSNIGIDSAEQEDADNSSLWLAAQQVRSINSIFENNYTPLYIGPLVSYNISEDSTAELQNTTIKNSELGVRFTSHDVIIQNSDVSNNYSKNPAYYQTSTEGPPFSSVGVSMYYNPFYATASLTIEDSNISENTNTLGSDAGIILFLNVQKVNLTRNSISNNQVILSEPLDEDPSLFFGGGGRAGFFYMGGVETDKMVEGSDIKIKLNTFYGNSVDVKGAPQGFNSAGSMTYFLQDVEFRSNTVAENKIFSSVPINPSDLEGEDGPGFSSFSGALSMINLGSAPYSNNLFFGNVDDTLSPDQESACPVFAALMEQIESGAIDPNEQGGFPLSYFSTSEGGNITPDNTCSLIFNQPSDRNNTQGLIESLQPLGDYGGPTKTVALKPGSPAIDAGVLTEGYDETTDQRGFLRPVDGIPDSGSYEYGSGEGAPGTGSPSGKILPPKTGTSQAIVYLVLTVLPGVILVLFISLRSLGRVRTYHHTPLE